MDDSWESQNGPLVREAGGRLMMQARRTYSGAVGAAEAVRSRLFLAQRPGYEAERLLVTLIGDLVEVASQLQRHALTRGHLETRGVLELLEEIAHRHIERARLGTAYTAIVEHVAALMARSELAGAADLVVDATGVGAAVVDGLRAAGLDPVPVTITAGRRISYVDGVWRVPKRALVTALVSAMEGGRLKVARSLPGAAALGRELAAFKVQITSHQHAAFNGAGEHDDLVLSLALAVWWAANRHRAPQLISAA